MNKTEFETKMTELMGPSTPFNSNNKWGFAGGTGVFWQKEKVTVKLFVTGYRHLRSENVVTVTVNGARIVDLLVTPRSLLRAYDYTRYHLNPVPSLP
jgi:hypothetical protein